MSEKIAMHYKIIIVSMIVTLTSSISTPVLSQENIESDAWEVLKGSSDFIAGLDSFTVDTEVGIETVSTNGQKLLYISSGEIQIMRPQNLYVKRKGSIMDVEIFVSNGLLTVHAKTAGQYAQFSDHETVDKALETLETVLNFDISGSDFVISNPLDRLITEDTTGEHIGMTEIDGDTVHHLAFRNKSVDWQIWIADGELPLPLKYIVTTKWVTSAPQYSIDFTNWAPNQITEPSRFLFSPRDGDTLVKNLLTDARGELFSGKE